MSKSELHKVEAFVLDQVKNGEHPLRPRELIEAAKRASHSAGAVRWMIWNLRARGLVDFTADYRIILARVAA